MILGEKMENAHFTFFTHYSSYFLGALTLRLAPAAVPLPMQKRPRKDKPATPPLPTAEEQRELEAKRNLSNPPKERTEVTIGPTDRSGPDVVLE